MKPIISKFVLASALLAAAAASTFANGIFQKVSQGGYHALAIATNGTLWSWGDNTFGQLGDARSNILSASQVGTDNNWQSIYAGENHSLAIKTDGTLWAWGYNISGELGDGTTNNSFTPIQIGADTDWSMVVGGQGHTVALKSNGTLWAWGYNLFGQVGDGTTINKLLPTQIGSDNTWRTIAAGLDHTIGIKSNGTLWAWGKNSNGQLGDGTTTSTNSPEQIGSDTDWVMAAGGNVQTVATKTTNLTLWAWGLDVISNSSFTGFSQILSPEVVQTPAGVISYTNTYYTGITSIGAAGYHSVALGGGTQYSWGYDAYELGNSNFAYFAQSLYPNPTLVYYPWGIGNPDAWAAISTGLHNILALHSDGTAWEVGFDSKGSGPYNQSLPPYSFVKVLLTANITLGSLSQTYDGTAKSVSAVTGPTGLNVVVTYNGSPNPPTSVGSYAVVATVQDSDYFGQTNGTLVISQAVAPVILGNLTQYYDGAPKSVSVATTPSGLAVDVSYNGSPNPPIAVGSYPVVATINDVNYQGSISNNLVITNLPFALANGTYTGLFYQSNNVTHQSSGYFTLHVAGKEQIGGSILIDGSTYPLAGKFDTNTASTTLSVLRSGQNTLSITLQLSSGSTVSGSVSDGVWTASLFGNKNYYSLTNPCPLAGSYAMTFAGSGNGTSAPNFGTRGVITVRPNGTISLSGNLADATVLAQSAVMSQSGTWPFYQKLYKGTGSAVVS